jgi:hypothetical protein
MKVGTGAVAGTAHFPNLCTLLYLIALFYRNYIEVGVHGLVSVSMA